MDHQQNAKPPILNILVKILATAAVLFVSYIAALFLLICGSMLELWLPLIYVSMLLLPSLLIPLIFLKKRLSVLKIWCIGFAVFLIAAGINIGYIQYDKSITINTSPNIDLYEYLPFQEESKIVKLDHDASLQLTEDLPILDGAAAVFPVYSAFVNATYPQETELYDGVFEYNNTLGGYRLLAEKKTNIFFGGYPSEDQITYAESNGTEFVYTPIAQEAFVFFVHKDNPVNNLTTEQVQAIYAGEITNWKEVGGNDEAIAAFQRNEGSGSQSQLVRFMDGKEIMDAPTELVNGFMSGIIEQVSDYRSRSGSIGFSFRYYVESIIQNPDIKLLSIDGVAPTAENIKNRSYPLVSPLYAVTYAGDPNKNVQKLLDWILSEEGQLIIEKTGYVGISP